MAEIKYNINDLIIVTIDEKVRPEIIREIDFQIGYFKNNHCSNNNSVPQVKVFSYEKIFEIQGVEKNHAEFYTCSGIPGQILFEPKNRLCILKKQNVICIYSDYPNFLINLYLQLLITGNGYSMIHAGGFVDSNGNATLVTGAGGIGKTAIVGYAVKEKGLKHLGDDIVIMGAQGDCFPFPRKFVLKSYHRDMYSETFQKMNLPRINFYAFKRFFVENSPFVGVGKSFLRKTGLYYSVADILRPTPHLATVSTEEIFGENSVAKEGKLKCLLYLDRVDKPDFQITELGQDEMVNRLFSVIHFEWKDFTTHLLSLGSLNVVDLKLYFSEVIENLSKSVSVSKLLYIQIPKNASPELLVEYFDQNKLF